MNVCCNVYCALENHCKFWKITFYCESHLPNFQIKLKNNNLKY